MTMEIRVAQEPKLSLPLTPIAYTLLILSMTTIHAAAIDWVKTHTDFTEAGGREVAVPACILH